MKRVITALILLPAVLYLVLWSPAWAVLAATALVALLCYHEFAGIAAAYEANRFGPLGYAAGLLILAFPERAGMWMVAVTLAALALALHAADLRRGILRSAFLALGVVYIFGSWQYAPLLASLNRYWLAYALVLNWAGDIGAYYVGRSVGRHKLAPRVSPGKSWEGAAASLAASLIFGVVFLRWAFPGVSMLAAAALTVAANIAGQTGDLCESALKRGAGVKDSGTLLPGHGGMLDRVDSSLFALPVVYWCVTFGRLGA